MGDYRVQTKHWRSDTCKVKVILSDCHVKLSDEGIPESDVHTEWPTIERTGEFAFGSKPEAVILHPFVPDIGMARIKPDLKAHGVAEVETPGCLKLVEDAVGRSRHSKVDVLGRARSRQPQLENEPALEDHGVAGNLDYPRKEAIEDKQLPTAAEVDPTQRGGS